MRFAGRSLSLAVFVVLAHSGCAAGEAGAGTNADFRATPQSTPLPDATPIASVDLGEAPDPLGLVNLWRVSGAEGEGVDTWLRVDALHFELWRDCGIVSGAWRTNGHMFEASTSAASAECSATMDVAWLRSASSFRATADGWELTDAVGEVVATLTIDGAPAPIDSAAVFYTEPPVITDATREAVRQPVSLPDGLAPATGDDLIGLWVPVGDDGSGGPNVFFDQGGTWKNSADCGGGSGTWATDGQGAFLSSAPVSHSLVACATASVTYAVEEAKSVALDGDTLRLIDGDGTELMQLERA